jgi:hypothetical protein
MLISTATLSCPGGFVTMLDPKAALEILRDTQVIDGKVVDCKSAVPRETLATKPLLEQPARVEEPDYRVARCLQGCRRLFLGDLPCTSLTLSSKTSSLSLETSKTASSCTIEKQARLEG